MNKDKIKKILDKTDIYVLDEINILEYIDELEKVKEDYIKSLDKLDVLENRNNKAIEYINSFKEDNPDFNSDFYKDGCFKTRYSFEDIVENTTKTLKGEDNE